MKQRPARLVLLLLLLPLALAAGGCGRPEQIGADPEAFKAVDALYTAVTSKRAELLDKSEKQLGALNQAGRLPDRAHRDLGRIIARARAGGWERAADELHSFMRGQERPPQGRHRRGKGP